MIAITPHNFPNAVSGCVPVRLKKAFPHHSTASCHRYRIPYSWFPTPASILKCLGRMNPRQPPPFSWLLPPPCLPLQPTSSQRKCHTSICATHVPQLGNNPQVQAADVLLPPPPEVSLRHADLSYGNKRVLRDLSLDIRSGESTAIIGTSGTGKSTALRVIAGLEMPDSGEVMLRGLRRERSVKLEKGRLNVSMVFQSAALFDSMTVGENVGFRLFRDGMLPEERVYELVQLFLKRVDLEDAVDKYPEELSGGMRKRASLARAIISDPDKPETAPDLILYDEPTAGLDPTASTRIENLIRSTQDVCPTCVIVTHQFSTIRRTADRVIMMHEGGVVWDGMVTELDNNENPYLRQFMTGSLDGPLNSDDIRLA